MRNGPSQAIISLLLSPTTKMEYYKWLVTGEIRHGVYHTEYVSL